MNRTIQCPSCAQNLEVEPAWAGQQVDCPLCATSFVVPTPKRSRKAVWPIVAIAVIAVVGGVSWALNRPAPATESKAAELQAPAPARSEAAPAEPSPEAVQTAAVVAAQAPSNPVVAAEPSPPAADDRILGETAEALNARYGKPVKEAPNPEVPEGLTQIFEKGDRRIVVGFVNGKAVQVVIGSPEDIAKGELEKILEANAQGSSFRPQQEKVGLRWDREDHKISATYLKVTNGYVFAMVPKESLDSATEKAVTPALKSVAEWREKAKSVIGEQMASFLGTRRVIVEHGGAFFDAVGKPDATGQEGNYAMFSWKCRDGVIVVMANAQLWEGQKILVIEDFSSVAQ